MKKLLTPFFALALLLSACVPSLHPLYTLETIVFREELVGIWKEKPDDDESWTFTKAGDKAYNLVIKEDDESSVLQARLVKLGNDHFLDLAPDGDMLKNAKIGGFYQATLVPGHLILKVKLGEKLELSLLDHDKLKKFLAANPKVLAHTLAEDDRLVITAPTAELQAFIKKHSASAELWGDPGVMQKILL